MSFLIGMLLSYGLGAIPMSYLLGRCVKGIDIRAHGSGNVGATNVCRVLGPRWGALALTFDCVKGMVCVWLFTSWFMSPELNAHATKVAFGICAILGHVFPVFLGFKGGKGVATSLGVFLGLHGLATTGAMLVFLVVVWWSHYISLGSIAAAITLPILMYIMSAPKLYLVLSMVVSALVVLKHKPNIRRMVLGEEHKFMFRKEKR